MLLWLAPSRRRKPSLLATLPTVNQTNIVFSYGGYLWTVPRSGGEARQLTTGGTKRAHSFSDGKWIAFYGEYDGNAEST